MLLRRRPDDGRDGDAVPGAGCLDLRLRFGVATLAMITFWLARQHEAALVHLGDLAQRRAQRVPRAGP